MRTGYLNALAQDIRDINRENGWVPLTTGDWNDKTKAPATLSLIHSEVSEALEAFRHNDPDNFMEEMADVIIRTLDCAAAFGNIDEAVAEKLEKNRGRGYRHGGKRI